MKRILVGVLGILLYFFWLSLPSVFAVSLSIVSSPSTITDEAFTLTASVSGATAGTNYLRVDIFKENTSNYFGETYNGSDWYGGSTFSQYFPITIVSGTVWNGTIQGRIGSPSANDYDGTGSYKIKLRRYTNGGGYTSSESSQSAVAVAISVPTVTPTSTLTPTPAPTNSPSPAPTKTPTPTNSPTKTPTITQRPSETPKISLTDMPEETRVVLGENTVVEKQLEESSDQKDSSGLIPFVMMGVGLICIGGCGILAYRGYLERKKLE